MRGRLVGVTGIAAIVLIGIVVLFASAGFFDRDAVHLVAAKDRRQPIGVVYFTGDMGVWFGMSADTIPALTAHGQPVYAINSPTLFAARRTQADVDKIVADAVRDGLAATRSDRIVLIGQSYGADILQTGLATLPADLRKKVVAVVLVVPGDTVFFRADPSGLVYHGTPDSMGLTTARRLNWVPFTCIYGAAETDSLCPKLAPRTRSTSGVSMPNLNIIAMPGGHFLKRDSAALIAHVLDAIRVSTKDLS